MYFYWLGIFGFLICICGFYFGERKGFLKEDLKLRIYKNKDWLIGYIKVKIFCMKNLYEKIIKKKKDFCNIDNKGFIYLIYKEYL